MDRRLVLLDFDRTVFDSERFYPDAMKALRERHQIDTDDFTIIMEDYSSNGGETFDLFSELHQHSGLSADKTKESLRTALAYHDYLFSDVIPFLKANSNDSIDIAILSTGHEAWQMFKLTFCLGLPKTQYIVPFNKGRYLKEHLEVEGQGLRLSLVSPDFYKEIILVDDRPSTFEFLKDAPRQLKQFRILRQGTKYQHLPTPENVAEVSSLNEVVVV